MSKIDETTQPDSIRILARRMYEAYTGDSDNLNFQGAPCPTWGDLPTAIRAHWCASAILARDSLVPPRPARHAPRELAVDPTIARLGARELVDGWRQLIDSGIVDKIRIDVHEGELESFDTMIQNGDAMGRMLERLDQLAPR